MKAIDVMVRDVVTVKPGDDVNHAIALLAEHDVSALPVVDDSGAVVGVVSEADLMHRDEIGTRRQRSWWMEAVTPGVRIAGEYAKEHGHKVAEIMSGNVVSASEDTPLGEIAGLLEKHRIKRLPVLRDGKLVGIVSRSNLIQALAASHAQVAATDGTIGDRGIRLELLDRMSDQTWTDFGSRNVIVRDGVVHLWGLVGSDEERKALLALAEDVPGVKSVCDETFPAY